MALFQFTALDNTGTEKRGTIEAVTQQEAITAIQRYGLQPTNVFAVNQPQPGAWGPAAGGLPYGAGYPAAPSGGAGGFTLFVSLLALLISLGVLGWQLYAKFLAPKKQPNSTTAQNEAPNPLGKGLKAYNFSTPEAAYRSLLQIERNRDILARWELDDARDGPELREKTDTVQIRKQEEWKGTTLLFIEYKKKGVKQYVIEGFEKDNRSNLWLRKYVSSYTVRKESPDLANRMDKWTGSGNLAP
jgi:hypothetical protein